MYSFIEGEVIDLKPTQVVVLVQGIGYEIEIGLRTFEKIKSQKEVRLYVQFIVREDMHALYGFLDAGEKTIFNKLISVSGIGPNTARLVLSSLDYVQVIHAIQANDASVFKEVKGIGAKTAQRIILDLKDKLGEMIAGSSSSTSSMVATTPVYTATNEAQAALMHLGFKKPQVDRAVQQAMKSLSTDATVEDIIKASLAALTGTMKS